MYINTGIYVRVSTEEQAINGYSIRAQKEKLSSYSKIKDWNIIDYYIDDGISGKNISERNELLRLIDDIKIGKVNNVLVYKIDRLTRSTRDLIDLVELFNKYNCSFNSLSESIDTKSSTGRMFIKIIGIFAEFERENIVERVKLGLERKVKEGYTIASKNISFGYKKEKGKKIQEIVKEEAEIVNKIYDLFILGKTYTEIAKFLNINNILTKNKKKWSYKTVKLVLNNPNYIGNVRYGINTNKYFETKGKHKSIIDINKYNSVKKIVSEKKQKNTLFLERVYCKCGNKMKVKRTYYDSKKKGKSIYCRYICTNKECNFNSISEKNIEKKVAIEFDFPYWNKLTFLEKQDYIFNNIKKIIVSSKEIKEIIYLHNATNLSK